MLKHLAYLTLFYEDVFSGLHRPRRTPYNSTWASHFAASNRTAFCC